MYKTEKLKEKLFWLQTTSSDDSMMHLAQTKWHRSRSVCTILDERFVELSTGIWMDHGPTVITIVLQTDNIGTEEWSVLSTASQPLTFITDLVLQDVRLNFNLQYNQRTVFTFLDGQVQNKHWY